MTRTGTLLEKEPGLHTVFQGEEHPYVRCALADLSDPERHFECRVLDEQDIPFTIGDSITLEIIKVITERHHDGGVVRFYCRLPATHIH